MSFRRHWYQWAGALAVPSIIGLLIYWNELSPLTKINASNFITILLLHFESFQFPGGFPGVINVPIRYPLNQKSAMIVSCYFAIAIYLPPVIWPRSIRLPIYLACAFHCYLESLG
eukprot:Protomagalhaensia_wolfi_Nauph_80__5856@NODE_747_length_2034_cov_204_971930_g560_i0_p3_GENE_NODE_747_length_2034_cov_204_971930_g560_i0NODE_747_length_2034_cov_204_971930_g560_i0_p3_ORF_typecomplete_len115_score11_38_NODE_747_length_2034_cov_204_971930_g560_i010231367